MQGIFMSFNIILELTLLQNIYFLNIFVVPTFAAFQGFIYQVLQRFKIGC